jgi:hypothetical protein
MPREKAEKSYEIMERYLDDEVAKAKKAQTKMLETLIKLCKERIIRL